MVYFFSGAENNTDLDSKSEQNMLLQFLNDVNDMKTITKLSSPQKSAFFYKLGLVFVQKFVSWICNIIAVGLHNELSSGSYKLVSSTLIVLLRSKVFRYSVSKCVHAQIHFLH